MKNNKPYQALLETAQGRALYALVDSRGLKQLAFDLGVEQYIMNNWVHIWRQCSPEGALLIEQKIGDKYTKEFMRPDITNWEVALRPKRNLVAEAQKTSKGRALIAVIQKAGGRTALATLMEMEPNSIDCWVQRGAVPIARAQAVADKLGMDVASVRPDKFEGVVP